MNDIQKEKPKTTDAEREPIDDATDTSFETAPPLQPGIRERVWKFLRNVQKREPVTKQALAKDRTRSLTFLIGGTVGAVLLFLGVFSTPSTQPIDESRGRSAPNLGRPMGQNGGTTASRGSATP